MFRGKGWEERVVRGFFEVVDFWSSFKFFGVGRDRSIIGRGWLGCWDGFW